MKLIHKIGAFVLAGTALLASYGCRPREPIYVNGKVKNEKFEKGGFALPDTYTFSLETGNEMILFKSTEHEEATGLDALINDGDTVKLEIWKNRIYSPCDLNVRNVISVNDKKVRETYHEIRQKYD